MTEAQEFMKKRRTLNSLLWNVAKFDPGCLFSVVHHTPGYLLDVMGVMDFYLTKPRLCKNQLPVLCEAIEYLKINYPLVWQSCFRNAAEKIAKENLDNDDWYLNMNEFAQNNLKTYVEEELNKLKK
jgi:hypothetical protein